MTTRNGEDDDRGRRPGRSDERSKRGRREEESDERERPRSAAEWVSLALSLLLLAGLVAAIVGLWATSSGEPARFALRPGGPAREAGGTYYLPVTLTNEGDTTASQVTIEGEVTPPEGGEPETASTTIDFVPGRSTAEAELLFSTDPAGARLRVTSYQHPLP